MKDMRIENGKIIIAVEPDDVHWLISEWKADDEATKEVWRLWAELNPPPCKFSDLVLYNFHDETSQFDDAPKEWNGSCYMREFTAYVPARLIRRRPDLIHDFIAKHDDDEWLWSCVVRELQ